MLIDKDGQKQYKVLVGVPCGEMVHADFALDLSLMLSYTTYVKPDMVVPVYFLKGTYLPRARAALVQKAKDLACTHILFLDADMRFPKDTLLHLLSREKHVVAANYPTRQAPIIPTALDEQYQPMFTGEGLTEARVCGMGVMLVDLTVFGEKPWFAVGYSKQSDDYSGEDTYFCEMARKHGYAVWIDWALSEQVRHVGGFVYDMTHARMTLEAVRGVDDVH